MSMVNSIGILFQKSRWIHWVTVPNPNRWIFPFKLPLKYRVFQPIFWFFGTNHNIIADLYHHESRFAAKCHMVGELYSNHILYIYTFICEISSFIHRFASHAISPLESRFIWLQDMLQSTVHPKVQLSHDSSSFPHEKLGKLARLYSMGG